jgi:hypothetical protein
VPRSRTARHLEQRKAAPALTMRTGAARRSGSAVRVAPGGVVVAAHVDPGARRLADVLAPLPVWTYTDFPAPSEYVPNVYLCALASARVHPVRLAARVVELVIFTHSLFRLAVVRVSLPGLL